MVAILPHVRFYIIKYEWHGTGYVAYPVLTNLDKRKKMADHEEDYALYPSCDGTVHEFCQIVGGESVAIRGGMKATFKNK